MKYEIEKDFTIEKLIGLYTQKKINLNPLYQRKDIWSTNDKKLLIDSIQKGFPIQNFYMQQKDAVFDMVDGQQRARAIFGYYKNIFPSNAGLFFKNLNKTDAAHFLVYKLELAIITKLEGDERIEVFYSRVNKTGKKLNRPELKRAEYYESQFFQLIQEIAEMKEFEELDLITPEQLKRMIDMDYISELLALLKNGITEKKIEVDKLYERDITEEESSALSTQFKKILSHFTRFNKIKPMNETRYNQKNDFYTLFGFVKDNIELKKETLDIFYKILVFIDEDITPSNEDCIPFYDYAINCVTQSNSKSARESRLKFLNSLFLNKLDAPNDIQKKILKYYELKPTDITKIEGLTILDIGKLKSVTSKS